MSLVVVLTLLISKLRSGHNVFRRNLLTNASTYLQNRDRHTRTWLKYLRLTPLRHTELNLTMAAMMINQPRSPEVPGCSCPNVSGGLKTGCLEYTVSDSEKSWSDIVLFTQILTKSHFFLFQFFFLMIKIKPFFNSNRGSCFHDMLTWEWKNKVSVWLLLFSFTWPKQRCELPILTSQKKYHCAFHLRLKIIRKPDLWWKRHWGRLHR